MHDEYLLFDNAVFSNFARIEKLDLLFKYSKKILTTREVIEEIQKGVEKQPRLNKIFEYQKAGKIKIVSTEKEETILLMSDLINEGVLGKGEISSICVAKELNGIFITDDKTATKKAANLGVKILDSKEYRDTVTILKTLRREKFISVKEYDDIKTLLKNQNFIF